MLEKKGEEHFDPDDPPRYRANKKRGHGTYQTTLEKHIHHFTLAKTQCSTDEWLGYENIIQAHAIVNHGEYE